MEEIVILELNQNRADRVEANGDYHCTLAKPVTINEGDTVNIRMASIDSQKSDSQTIIIQEDEPIKITFSYYDVDYDKENKRVQDDSGDWPDPTFDYYMGYATRPTFLLDSVEYFYSDHDVKQGNHISIRATLGYTDVDGISQETVYYAKIRSDAATGTKEVWTLVCEQVNGAPVRFQDGTLRLISMIAKKADNLVSNDHVSLKRYVTSAELVGSRKLDIQTSTINIPAGRYDPSALAVLMTEELQRSNGVEPVDAGQAQIFDPQNPFLARVDDTRLGQLEFRKGVTGSDLDQDIDFDNNNTYIYKDGASPPRYFFGASKMAIEFGKNGEVFQWSYGHTPLYGEDDQGNVVEQSVGFYLWQDGGFNRINMVTTSTGIVIHDLQPQAFWETLGLYDKMIVPLRVDTNGIYYYDSAEMKKKIPTGFAGITTFDHNNNRVPFDFSTSSKRFVDITDQVEPIIGDALDLNPTGGYYFVEIDNINHFTCEFLDNNGDHPNIKAIVSKQYTSNDMITGFSDAGIPYVHKGTPFLITESHVRILDPKTKQAVADLGDNNTIFLQINRAIQPQLPPPMPRADDRENETENETEPKPKKVKRKARKKTPEEKEKDRRKRRRFPF